METGVSNHHVFKQAQLDALVGIYRSRVSNATAAAAQAWANQLMHAPVNMLPMLSYDHDRWHMPSYTEAG